jgi:hypothetical protein
MSALAATFDRIIIDTPALSEAPDGTILAAGADATVLVFRMGQSLRPVDLRAIRGLERVGVHVVGAVANDVVTPRGAGYYTGAAWQYATYSRRFLTTRITAVAPAAAGVSPGIMIEPPATAEDSRPANGESRDESFAAAAREEPVVEVLIRDANLKWKSAGNGDER